MGTSHGEDGVCKWLKAQRVQDRFGNRLRWLLPPCVNPVLGSEGWAGGSAHCDLLATPWRMWGPQGYLTALLQEAAAQGLRAELSATRTCFSPGPSHHPAPAPSLQPGPIAPARPGLDACLHLLPWSPQLPQQVTTLTPSFS